MIPRKHASFALMIGLLIVYSLLPLGECATAATLHLEDSHTRVDGTALGTTEIGGAHYIEIGPISPASANTADILSGALRVFGETGPTSSAAGIALIGANLSDVSIAADFQFSFPNGVVNTSTYNFAGFVLRRNGVFGDFGIANEGLIEVGMHVGGGVFIREVRNGALNILVNNVNPYGLGGSGNNVYSGPGQLPVTINGLPFDANNNGRLDNEPFRLSADLIGNVLTVAVNGVQVANVMTTASAPARALSFPGLIKNRFTSGGTRDIATPVYDNLVIDGTVYDVAPIVHSGMLHPANNEKWTPANGSAGGGIFNAAVNDDGVDAWNINDQLTTANSFAGWARALTPEQVIAANTNGWRLKGRIRVGGVADALDGAIEMSAFAGSDLGYTLWLGSNAQGEAVVGEFGGITPTFALGRTVTVGEGYHDYEMRFDSTSQTVDVFVDGALAIDDMIAINRNGSVLNRILWGSNSSTGTGNGYYASVAFSIVPEPSSMVLLAAAIAFSAALRQREVR